MHAISFRKKGGQMLHKRLPYKLCPIFPSLSTQQISQVFVITIEVML